MKINRIIFILTLLSLSSCATLNIQEIRNLERSPFEPLQLQPGSEVNHLRIDLIRQTTSEQEPFDSTSSIKESPYHYLGFELGNGLFIDLNGNLCLKVSYLLGFSTDSDFEIHQNLRPGRKSSRETIIRFNNDTLTLVSSFWNRERYQYHRTIKGDSTTYWHRKRFDYAVVETDSSLIYRGRYRIRDIIARTGDNRYRVNKKLWKQNFEKKGNKLILNKKFVISTDNNNLSVQIKQYGRKKNRLLYTIEQNPDKIFIYSKQYQGIKIERDKNHLLVYRDNRPVAEYELIR